MAKIYLTGRIRVRWIVREDFEEAPADYTLWTDALRQGRAKICLIYRDDRETRRVRGQNQMGPGAALNIA